MALIPIRALECAGIMTEATVVFNWLAARAKAGKAGRSRGAVGDNDRWFGSRCRRVADANN